MSKQKKQKKELRPVSVFPVIILWLCLTASSVLFVYPSFTNSLSNIEQVSSIGGYEEGLLSMSEEERQAEIERIRIYNEKIRAQQAMSPFGYMGALATDEEYESLLSHGRDNGNVMGIIDIPSINVYLPVAHGTTDEILSYEAGHMYGSSLPYGGESTHAIIAAHTGLPTARLFTDVKKMKVGDEFIVHVLNEGHRYQVVEVNVAPQGDAEKEFLQIESGKDYVTLYTCSPNGVNDHRILVRGERVYPDLASGGESGNLSITNRNKRAIIMTAIWGSIPIVVLLIGIIQIIRTIRNNRKYKKAQAEAEKEIVKNEN